MKWLHKINTQMILCDRKLLNVFFSFEENSFYHSRNVSRWIIMVLTSQPIMSIFKKLWITWKYITIISRWSLRNLHSRILSGIFLLFHCTTSLKLELRRPKCWCIPKRATHNSGGTLTLEQKFKPLLIVQSPGKCNVHGEIFLLFHWEDGGTLSCG